MLTIGKIVLSCFSHLDVQITVPQQRMTPLKTTWLSLYTPVTEQLHLDMRMNLKTRKVGTQPCEVAQRANHPPALGPQHSDFLHKSMLMLVNSRQRC